MRDAELDMEETSERILITEDVWFVWQDEDDEDGTPYGTCPNCGEAQIVSHYSCAPWDSKIHVCKDCGQKFGYCNYKVESRLEK